MNIRQPSLIRKRLNVWVILAAAVALVVPAVAAVFQAHELVLPRGNETRMVATFNLSLGTVRSGKAPASHLLTASVDLHNDELEPELDVHRTGRTANVTLGLTGGGGISFRGVRNRGQNTWDIGITDQIPLELNFNLGMSSSEIDLGGLQVESLNISAGMSSTTVAFSEPNQIVMPRFHVDAGAASFTGDYLGNARFERFSFSGGAGSFTLDFRGGPLPENARADIDVGASRLRVVLPEDQPVVLYAPESWFTRLDVPRGYIHAGRGEWHNPLVRDPNQAIEFRITAGIGRVIIVTDPSQF